MKVKGEFLDLFSGVLSADRINTDLPEAYYNQNTTGVSKNILGILNPVSDDEIQKIIDVARQNNLKLYPISTGKNWGYSDSFPVQDDNVVLDLGLMKGITDYDPDLGCITVQPGVSQKMLADFLKANGDRHIVSVTGSSPDASIVGNYLERGYGITPIADHTDAIMRIEAVLPDGSLYKSLMSGLDCEPVDRVYKWGLGPYVDGLFSQSNFGIVTRMTIQLAVRPEKSCIVLCEVDQSSFCEVTEAARSVRERWAADHVTIKFFNQFYLSVLMGGRDHQSDLSDWAITFNIYGSVPLVRACLSDIKDRLRKPVKKLVVVDKKKLAIGQKIKRFLGEGARKRLDALSHNWDYIEGCPCDYALRFAYSKHDFDPKDFGAGLDPARDECGIIWYAPVLPFSGNVFSDFQDWASVICADYGFDPVFNMTSYRGMSCSALVPLVYQKGVQDQNARDCYFALLEYGFSVGIAPYRSPSFAMEKLFSDQNSYPTLLQKIKVSLDPQRILAPGRYNIF